MSRRFTKEEVRNAATAPGVRKAIMEVGLDGTHVVATLPSADTGGHRFQPHTDTVLAGKGWLRCYDCGREVHGSLRTGNWTDRCPRLVKGGS